jgi:UDPglucose 6-dehydrogenase
LVEKVRGLVSKGRTVLVLGVSYKPDTYITEESAGLHLAQELKCYGYRVLIHDFAANQTNDPALEGFEFVKDLARLGKRGDIDLAVICCPWPQYANLKFSSATKVLPTWKL